MLDPISLMLDFTLAGNVLIQSASFKYIVVQCSPTWKIREVGLRSDIQLYIYSAAPIYVGSLECILKERATYAQGWPEM